MGADICYSTPPRCKLAAVFTSAKPMSRIALLIAETDELIDGNYLRFANSLFARDHHVTLCPVESLSMASSRIVAEGFTIDDVLEVDEAFPAMDRVWLDDYDAIWILSLGMRQSFLDKMQLLFTLSDKCRLINSLDALMHFKSKYFTASHGDVFRHPETWASNRPADLVEVINSHGGKWVVKPPASSFGRDVYLLTPDDPNKHVIIESMCGPEEDQFCLLQRYIDEIEDGEKRVLLAGGKPVGQYLRRAARDHRTNVLQGATVEACTLSDEERVYCEKIGERLLSYGAEFVGMDLVYPWVIEFNVVNPGGLLTIEQVDGVDLTDAILDEIIAPRC